MKDNKTKIIIISVVTVLVIAICVGVVCIINGSKSKKDDNVSNNTASDNSSDLFGKSEELGTKVEFNYENKIKLPEKVDSGHTEKSEEESWFYDLDEEGNAINAYVYGKFSGEVTIPSELDGHKVISIGQEKYGITSTLFHKSLNAEDYIDNITSIIVPDGVKYINGYAFYGMDGLEKVTLPDSIIYIGDGAFESSDNLSRINSDIDGKIVMPKDLQYYGENLFRGNYKINSFEFPEQIDYIQRYTFYETKGFTDVTIPAQFKCIGEGAFSSSKTKSLTIEDGVEIIQSSAFSMNEELTRVDIADSVISIERDAFLLCKALEELKYDGKLKYIGKDAFSYTKFQDTLNKNQLP